ncbi:hypothetical protein Leryth_026580 [Lithospermum erythrorhizon]|nr:hypothetical protein Leryth_026580 [Lithospermum erythrorhizon]
MVVNTVGAILDEDEENGSSENGSSKDDSSKDERPSKSNSVTAFLEVVVPDHEEDNHEGDIDGPNMDKPSGDKSEDLTIVNEEQYVIMREKQKGLESALHELLPRIGHRNFVQHIFRNFKRHHGTQILRDKLWAYARASTKLRYNLKADLNKMYRGRHTWMDTYCCRGLEVQMKKDYDRLARKIKLVHMPRISKLLDKRISFGRDGTPCPTDLMVMRSTYKTDIFYFQPINHERTRLLRLFTTVISFSYYSSFSIVPICCPISPLHLI